MQVPTYTEGQRPVSGTKKLRPERAADGVDGLWPPVLSTQKRNDFAGVPLLLCGVDRKNILYIYVRERKTEVRQSRRVHFGVAPSSPKTCPHLAIPGNPLELRRNHADKMRQFCPHPALNRVLGQSETSADRSQPAPQSESFAGCCDRCGVHARLRELSGDLLRIAMITFSDSRVWEVGPLALEPRSPGNPAAASAACTRRRAADRSGSGRH